MLHYDELIRAYGPLINVWTFRFEQKHKYFKNIVRHSPNFINILHTLTEKHQLLQVYLSLTPKNVGILTPASDKLNSTLISIQLKDLIKKNIFINNQFDVLNVAININIGGYNFKSDQSVCVKINDNDELIAIRIKQILFENNSVNPIFVGPREIYKYVNHLNCYIFYSLSDNYNFVSLKELKTDKCLFKYNDGDKLFAIIHHF